MSFGFDIKTAKDIQHLLENTLLQSVNPSLVFENLRANSQLSQWFPELETLITTEQDVRHHPECSVWNHTMMVLDVCACFRDQAQNPLGFMLSALCHDFGKAVTTTRDGDRIQSYGHEEKGLPLVQKFLERIYCGQSEVEKNTALINYVLNMTALHMRPNMLVRQNSSAKVYRRMFRQAQVPGDLLLLAKADHLGRGNSDEEAYEETERVLRGFLEEFACKRLVPHLNI